MPAATENDFTVVIYDYNIFGDTKLGRGTGTLTNARLKREETLKVPLIIGKENKQSGFVQLAFKFTTTAELEALKPPGTMLPPPSGGQKQQEGYYATTTLSGMPMIAYGTPVIDPRILPPAPGTTTAYLALGEGLNSHHHHTQHLLIHQHHLQRHHMNHELNLLQHQHNHQLHHMQHLQHNHLLQPPLI
ncbi:hypothetical protein CEUSTIGMA_g9256.t1 [Chlamydomonas eustigma]|uniref:Uncharacterized protein n=1 Tax=Chlamydomonas eustigma TaxID=1157962 RepID=A0A250XFG7_9CHLO|nr:hypothetical protein CEUSTIGMA_g9256.t1 [Chlamydomonas eustigma]|eukprot:GAX81828.1 hypothetical protein CEUSTIGMA_g9256.t1 [Chlamydomonas eustigma]